MSDVFPFRLFIWITEGGGIYDKKRIRSVYRNITPISSSIYLTSTIEKNIWFQPNLISDDIRKGITSD